jgi:hypothetical protein
VASGDGNLRERMAISIICRIVSGKTFTTCARERGIEEYQNGMKKYLELARIKLARRRYWRVSGDPF